MRYVSGRRTWRLAVVIFAVVGMLATPAVASAADEGAPSERRVVAEFEGRTIDLSRDWKQAKACLVWQTRGIVKCMRTEKQLERWLDALDLALGYQDDVNAVEAFSATGGYAVRAGAKCSTTLKLYDYTNMGGASLYMRDRGYWQNLSSYGFNQRVSSFKVGACSTIMADYNNGGGARMPSSYTKAWRLIYSMPSGWNNDVSSVYIR
ncbi:MAG: hypothetical protein QNJ71_01555 [Acidimicrobiia bacterium]|nr:hypothetical protein [Acidimicrobiia bacterium]